MIPEYFRLSRVVDMSALNEADLPSGIVYRSSKLAITFDELPIS